MCGISRNVLAPCYLWKRKFAFELQSTDWEIVLVGNTFCDIILVYGQYIYWDINQLYCHPCCHVGIICACCKVTRKNGGQYCRCIWREFKIYCWSRQSVGCGCGRYWLWTSEESCALRFQGYRNCKLEEYNNIFGTFLESDSEIYFCIWLLKQYWVAYYIALIL